MFLGKIELKVPTVLAPMAGVTDLPFRILCKKQGVGLLVSEMVSAKGLLYSNQKTFELLKMLPEEQPLAIQLFGKEPEELARAAKIVQDFGAAIIDINMGCPVPKIVNNGEGSAILKNPELVYEILARIKDKIHIPLTVKIRSGWDENWINAIEVAQKAEKAGVAAIAVHARTRAQFYQGKADWNIIKQVVLNTKIPIIGNGDINSPEKAEEMLAFTGCKAVMIGRGAEGNPWIFKQISQLLSGEKIEVVSLEERFAMLLEHLQLLVEHKGAIIAVKEMRRHALSYVKGLPFATEYRGLLNRAVEVAEFSKIVQEYQQRLKELESFAQEHKDY